MITATYRLLLPINRKHFNPLNFFYTREFASVEDFSTKSKLGGGKNSLPPKPKRPLNVFLMYYTSVRNKLQEEYPHCKAKELVVKASQKWAEIDPTIKQNLQKQYLEQASLYKKKLVDYENSLTNDQKVEIVQELLKKGQKFKKSEIKQKLLELGKPKRPLTAFMLFLQSKKNDKKPQVSHKDFLLNMSEEWKNMTTEAKNKYNEESKNLLEKYKIEMKKWEDNMIQADQRHEPREGLISYSNQQNTLQTGTKHLKITVMDAPINDPKKTAVQSHNTCIHIQIYTYFTSTWRRVFTVLKEIIENWRMKLF
ncbi:hypothetical protein PUN28_005170 [Cardiocondyla obscurior]|uniref:HMG box domain-containing protein n=1 Tax=Cardiocondyla obscurior TaxID=286306 RepID=A0AAW2GGE7_9HYME